MLLSLICFLYVFILLFSLLIKNTSSIYILIDSHSNLFNCLKELTGNNKSITADSGFEEYDVDQAIKVHIPEENDDSSQQLLKEILKIQEKQKEFGKMLQVMSARVDDEFKTMRHRLNDFQNFVEGLLLNVDQTRSETSFKKTILIKSPLMETVNEFNSLNKQLESEEAKQRLAEDVKFIGADAPQKFISLLVNTLFSKGLLCNISFTGFSTKSTKAMLKDSKVYAFIRGKFQF